MNQVRKKNKLEKIAYHEAGHAVAAYYLKRRFKSVTIIPSEGYLGLLESHKSQFKNFDPECDNSHRTVNRIGTEIMIDFAGGIAEKMAATRYNWRGSSQDWNSAQKLACYNVDSGEQLNAYVNWLWTKSKGMMRHEWVWHAVKMLAKELITHKAISYPKARKIIEQAEDEYYNMMRSPNYQPDLCTLDPEESLGFWLNNSTLVCNSCLKINEYEKIKKTNQILVRRDIRNGTRYLCVRCGKLCSRGGWQNPSRERRRRKGE